MADSMTARALMARLAGVLAFTPTPFTQADSLDAEGLRSHVDFLVNAGVHAVVVCGGMGEFFALDPHEYRTAMRTAAEAVRGRLPLLAGIGHGTRVASNLAEFAASVGVDGLLIHPQYFVEPSDEGVVRHYRELARACGLGMIVYSTRSAPVTLPLLRRLAEIDSVVALKDEYGDVELFGEMVRDLGGRLAWINGMAEGHAAPYFLVGAQAFTSGLVNVVPRLTLAVWSAGAAGRWDELRALVAKIRPLADLRQRRRGYAIAVVKEAMNLLGMPGGTLRSPLVPLLPEDREELRRALSDLGVLRQPV